MEAESHQPTQLTVENFWKWFGGAILGLLGVLLMVILTFFNNGISSTRMETQAELSRVKTSSETEFAKLKDDLTAIKTQLAAMEEFRLFTKDKLASLESGIKERANYSESNVALIREKDKEHDGKINEVRERLLKLEEKLAK